MTYYQNNPPQCTSETWITNLFLLFAVFDLVDRDGSGRVTKEELGELVSSTFTGIFVLRGVSSTVARKYRKI